MLTPENGDAILSLIAATSSVNATYQVFKFRSSLVAELVSAAALMALFLLQSFFEQVSATTIRLRAGFTAIQAAAGSTITVQSDQGASGARLEIAVGENASATVSADGTGTARIQSSDGTDFFAADPNDNQMTITRNNGISMAFNDMLTDFRFLETKEVALFTGQGAAEKMRVSPTALINRQTGDDDADDHLRVNERAIKNSDVIGAGQAIEIDPATGRIQLADGSGLPAGAAITGGTGNAGGSVKGTYPTRGIATLGVTDDAGITAGQYVVPGAVDLPEFGSQAAIEGSGGLAVLTTASTAPVMASWTGPM